MKPSSACYALVRAAEGFRLKAYQDSKGVWTIGTGSTRGVTPDMVITPTQAEKRLEEDMKDAADAVNRLATPCSQCQFDALTSFVFNEGASKFASSTLLHKHRSKNYVGAAGEFGKWIYCDGRILAGLIKRRAAEVHLYLSDEMTPDVRTIDAEDDGA